MCVCVCVCVCVWCVYVWCVLKTSSEIPEEISETSETVDAELEDQPDGNVIRVIISDGVGAAQR